MRRSKDKANNTVIRTDNALDGRAYRASIIWERKWIGVEEASLFPGRTELVRHIILAEAAVWSGGRFNMMFRPTVIFSYHPDEPTDIPPAVFRELVRAIVTEADLAAVVAGNVEAAILRFCEPFRIWPVFGYRRHLFTLRRLPHVLLFGWPSERSFPPGSQTVTASNQHG